MSAIGTVWVLSYVHDGATETIEGVYSNPQAARAQLPDARWEERKVLFSDETWWEAGYFSVFPWSVFDEPQDL